MPIRLLCPKGIVQSTGDEEDRYLVCVTGYNLCAKHENQGHFDEFCFVVEEFILNEEQLKKRRRIL